MKANKLNRQGQAKRFLNFLHPDKDTVFEIRLIRVKKPFSDYWQGTGKTPLGYFQSRSKVVKEIFCVEKDKDVGPRGIYITLNPVSEALLSRANNRLRAGINGTCDDEILCLQNLLVDLDPARPSGINSTDDELRTALDLAKHIQSTLLSYGWSEPYSGISGNGAVLIYRLPELPNDDKNQELLRKVLESLSSQFSTAEVEIDRSVYNASRLVRIPGTRNRKGDGTANRPQRYAEMISIPENPEPISEAQLIALANDNASQENSSSCENMIESRPGTLNVVAYLSHYGRKLRQTKQHGDSVLYVLEECVFDSDHKGGEAAIGKQKKGKLFYQCFHNSCKDRKWRDARKIISGDHGLNPFMTTSWNNETKGVSEKIEAGLKKDLNIKLVSLAEMMCMPKDTTPPVIEGVLYPRESLLITGASSVGKSTLILNAALALASGSPFLNKYETGEPKRVLLFQSENGYQTFRDRLSTMTHDWTGKREHALKNIFTPWQNRSPQLSGSLADRYGNPTDLVDTIERMIKDVGAEIIFFDPLISFHAADENDNSAMRKILDILTRLACKCNLTIIIAHHHGKGLHDGFNKSRGASAITDWPSSILTLTGGNKKGGRHIINGSWTKVRSFRPPDPLRLELVQGGTFRVVEDDISELTAQDIAKVLREAGNGRIVGRKNMLNAIQKKFGISRDKAIAALKRAIASGAVICEPDSDDKRRRIYRLPNDENLDEEIEDLEDLF